MNTQADHTCRCRGCEPSSFPGASMRQNEWHLSVGFGDNVPPRGPFCVYVATADGGQTELGKGVFEVQAGVQGWAICIRKPAHRCACGNGPCEYTRYGAFRFEQRREAAV